MKTLNEQIDEIIKSNTSKQTKSVSLVKLGLTPYEVKLLLGSVEVSKSCKFNANTLTFGVEIETYNVLRDALIREVGQRSISIQSEGYNHRDNNNYYKIVSDSSIRGNDGQEVVSPILKGRQGLNKTDSECAFRWILQPHIKKYGLGSLVFNGIANQLTGGHSKFAFMQGDRVELYGEFCHYGQWYFSNLRFMPYNGILTQTPTCVI